MNTIELETKLMEMATEMFNLHVKPEMEKWLKEHGFVRWEASMGGYIFHREDDYFTMTDGDFRESKDEAYRKFYKEYLENIVYRRGRSTNTILYNSCEL